MLNSTRNLYEFVHVFLTVFYRRNLMNSARICMVLRLIFIIYFEIKICLNMYQNGFVHGFLNIVEKKNLQNICHIYRVFRLACIIFLQGTFNKNLYVLACVVLGFFFLQNLMSIDHIYTVFRLIFFIYSNFLTNSVKKFGVYFFKKL